MQSGRKMNVNVNRGHPVVPMPGGGVVQGWSRRCLWANNVGIGIGIDIDIDIDIDIAIAIGIDIDIAIAIGIGIDIGIGIGIDTGINRYICIGIGIGTCGQGHCLKGFCVCIASPNLPKDPGIFIFLHLLIVLQKKLPF